MTIKLENTFPDPTGKPTGTPDYDTALLDSFGITNHDNPVTLTGSGTRSIARPTKWQPQRLKPHHRQIARMLLMGYSQAEIVQTVELTKVQVTSIINSDLFQAELARLETNADEQAIDHAKDLAAMTSRALEIISLDLAINTPSKGQTKTAFDILDRTGFHKAADRPAETNINILNIAPSPGDDPAAHIAAMETFKKQTLQEADAFADNKMLEEIKNES